jgi:hypothetical protein
MSAGPSESSESAAAGEVQISQTSVPFTDNGRPPHSLTSIEPSESGIKIEGSDIPKDREVSSESGPVEIYHC